MIKIDEAVIVEGKYDKIKLSGFIDGLIITTDGFRVFKNKEKQSLIRRLAETRGILILTDSDSAGFVIRNFLKGTVPPEKIRHAYIPDISGKEKRKDKPSKEGKLGVEGISEEILRKAISDSGVKCTYTGNNKRIERSVTKTDLYFYGLTGGNNSSERRNSLKKELGLPEHMTTNSILDVINCLMTAGEFEEVCDRLFGKEEKGEG